jgi:hypothetical protein
MVPPVIVEQRPIAARPTRRDYDYFAELDDLLARLHAEQAAADPTWITGDGGRKDP